MSTTDLEAPDDTSPTAAAAANPLAQFVQGPRGAALDAYWMPFTANRQFKKNPRLFVRAQGMHYWTDEGRQVLDAVAGLWCVNAGHNRPRIVQGRKHLPSQRRIAPTKGF